MVKLAGDFELHFGFCYDSYRWALWASANQQLGICQSRSSRRLFFRICDSS